MRLMMERTVIKSTGKRAKLDGYSAEARPARRKFTHYAARVYTHRYNASFMGFAPVNDPKIVIVVTLNGTPTGDRGFGGVVAAPVFLMRLQRRPPPSAPMFPGIRRGSRTVARYGRTGSGSRNRRPRLSRLNRSRWS